MRSRCSRILVVVFFLHCGTSAASAQLPVATPEPPALQPQPRQTPEDEDEFRKCMLTKLAGAMIYSKQVAIAATKFGSFGKDDPVKLGEKVEKAGSTLVRKVDAVEDRVGGCPSGSDISTVDLKTMADDNILSLVGAFSPGDAATLATILGGSCTPDCVGRVCGDDGCGGSCGTCGSGTVCHEPSGTCVVS